MNPFEYAVQVLDLIPEGMIIKRVTDCIPYPCPVDCYAAEQIIKTLITLDKRFMFMGKQTGTWRRLTAAEIRSAKRAELIWKYENMWRL